MRKSLQEFLFSSKRAFSFIKESALDPIHKNLNKDIFDKDRVRVNVSKEIIDNFYQWWNYVKQDAKNIKDIILIGSITGYQYADNSDLDVNINTNLEDSEIKALFSLLPNGNLLANTDHPINYYLTNNLDNVKQADSSYDLLNNKWIKEPDREDVEIPYLYAFEIAKFFMDGIDSRILEYERDKKELYMYLSYLKEEDIEANKPEIEKMINLKEQEIRADLDSIFIGHKLIRAFRGEAFKGESEDFLIDIKSKSPNKSINNLVYKILEKFEYLDKMIEYEKLRKEYLD